jgi:acyl-coenzyme A synthetase/AMP-(fatty) acid ligase
MAQHFVPLFFSSIQSLAKRDPYRIAVSAGHRNFTYKEFVEHIDNATRHLATIPSPANKWIAISIQDAYIHWIVVLAAARAGLVSVSTFNADAGTLDFLGVQLVVGDRPDGTEGNVQFMQFNESWLLSEGNSAPEFKDPPHSPDDPFRLVLSSGTTGKPKKIMLTHGLIQSRLTHCAILLATFMGSRTLTSVGIDTVAGFQIPLTTWLLGGRVVLRHAGEDDYQTIRRHDVTYYFTAPIILAALLERMPKGAPAIPGLNIHIGGSVLPQALSERAKAQLTPSLHVAYGSTEALLLTMGPARSENPFGYVGYVLPFAEVQVVDKDGKEVAPGVVGEVRARSIDCIDGYLRDDTDAAAQEQDEEFRDGWFYSGDVGYADPDGALMIVGRTNELLNLGGAKMAPSLIENEIAKCPGVKDVAVLTVEQANGIAEPWVAIVPGAGFDESKVGAAYAAHFSTLPPLSIARFKVIPRNAMGKVMRDEVRALIKKAVSEQAAAPA